MCIQLRDVPRKMCKWGSQNKYVEQSDLLQNSNVLFQESIEVQMQSQLSCLKDKHYLEPVQINAKGKCSYP